MLHFPKKIYLCSADIKPYSVDGHAYSVDVSPYSVDGHAYSVDVSAYSVDVHAYSVDVSPYSVDVTAYSVDVPLLVLRQYAPLARLPRIGGKPSHKP
ncbi:hypothetical protein [Sporolactobacillus spathodeae]|uniref:hypothetical protein n=1 Tax=Sporolactobacillus spathodeae TaxID=1465502 RepID=UPI0039E872F0